MYTPVKLEVAWISPSAPEAKHHVKEILSRISEISIYFATGELEPQGGAMPGWGAAPPTTSSVGSTSTARGRWEAIVLGRLVL